MAIKIMRPLQATAWSRAVQPFPCACTDKGSEGCSCQLASGATLPSEMRRQNIKPRDSLTDSCSKLIHTCWNLKMLVKLLEHLPKSVSSWL